MISPEAAEPSAHGNGGPVFSEPGNAIQVFLKKFEPEPGMLRLNSDNH